MKRTIRIGTRGSRLALAQAEIVVQALKARHGAMEVTVVPITTRGDTLLPGEGKDLDRKAAFTGAIEDKLKRREIDAAVHSLKDLPSRLDDGLVLAATPKRGDCRDALVSSGNVPFLRLPAGACLGTSSMRRRSQLLSMRPDIEVRELRGNVETRLRKLGEDKLDGIVVAAAGLARIGLRSAVTELFEPEEIVPAPCQGTIGVEARQEDGEVIDILRTIEDAETRTSSECERAFSEALGGDCSVPLGSFAGLSGKRLEAVGMVASPDGSMVVKVKMAGPGTDPAALGRSLAEKVRRSGGDKILEALEN